MTGVGFYKKWLAHVYKNYPKLPLSHPEARTEASYM